jgi:Fe-S cluster assembly protein SufD
MNYGLKINTNNYKKSFVVKKGETMNLETISEYNLPGEMGDVEVKTVVMEGGKLNLKGIIRIGKRGVGVNAFLKQRVLVVGDGAVVVAEPQLEIETDEVKASHAASVGKIDEEQLFYLRSKGMSEKQAKDTIIEAFLKG